MRTMSIGTSVLALALITAGCGESPQPTTQEVEQEAASQNTRVQLQPTQGNTVAGLLQLMPMGDGVHISGTVTGLPEGAHGFHIHETGDCSAPDASSAGGHFNPEGAPHGAPDAAQRHAGDLGNIQADATGSISVNIHASGINLEADDPHSVLGKAVIVHAQADDFTTQPTGNAGARLSCGVIELAE